MKKKAKSKYTAEELADMTAKELEGLLVEKQRLFIREYMIDRNGTQAAIRAGYAAGKDNHQAAVTASKLLKDPVVSACRAALLREECDRLAVSRQEIVLEYMEIYKRCMARTPVMEWDSNSHQWVETGMWQFDAKGAANALDKLSGLLGYKDKQAGDNRVTVTITGGEDFAK